MAKRKDGRKPNTYIKNGKEYISTSCKYVDDKGITRTKEFLGKTSKEAKAKKDKFLADRKAGLDVNLAKMSLYDAMDIWLFDVKRVDSGLKASSFARYECAFRIYIANSKLAKIRVSEITSLNVQQFLNYMADELDCSSDQCYNTFKVLRMFFIYALDEGYTTRNITKNVNIPGKKKSIEEKMEKLIVLSDEEWKYMKEYMHKTKYIHEFLIRFDMATGLRKGELLILKYSDIYDGFIHIVRNYGQPTVVNADRTRTRQTVIDDTKTEKSTRDVPLLDSLVPLLEEHRQKQTECLKKLGLPPSEYIFTSECGNLIDLTNLYKSFKRLLKRLGMEDRDFHSIRRTYITKLVLAGVPLPTIQDLVGHEDIKTTMGYVQISNKEKKESVQCIKAFI